MRLNDEVKGREVKLKNQRSMHFEPHSTSGRFWPTDQELVFFIGHLISCNKIILLVSIRMSQS